MCEGYSKNDQGLCLAILQSLANHIDENKKSGESYYKGAFQACKIWVHQLFRWVE
jgi:hypothetical protein